MIEIDHVVDHVLDSYQPVVATLDDDTTSSDESSMDEDDDLEF